MKRSEVIESLDNLLCKIYRGSIMDKYGVAYCTLMILEELERLGVEWEAENE